MSHNRTDSLASDSSRSTASGKTSTQSSHSSLIYSEPDYQQRIIDLINSDTPTPQLITEAEECIDPFSTCQESLFTYSTSHVRLDRIMSAMMDHAASIGGDHSRRYVAAAIISAHSDSIEQLMHLGVTWLTHLLFMFKANASHGAQLNQTPSRDVTPTADVETLNSEGAGNRRRAFSTDILKRDG